MDPDGFLQSGSGPPQASSAYPWEPKTGQDRDAAQDAESQGPQQDLGPESGPPTNAAGRASHWAILYYFDLTPLISKRYGPAVPQDDGSRDDQ